MKISKKVMGVALASTMVLSATSSFAAFPVPTVVVNDNAYSFDYFNSSVDAVVEVGAAITAGTPVYTKVGSLENPMYLDVVSSTFATAEDMPAVTYYAVGADAVKYAAGDGDVVVEGLSYTVGSTIMQDADGFYLPVTFSAALDATADYSEIMAIVGEAGEHLTVNGDATIANVDLAELDAVNPAVINLRMSNASVVAIPDGATLGFGFKSASITDAEGNVLADANLVASAVVANPFASGDVVVSALAATTDATSNLTTFAAAVANAEAGATATITITPETGDAIVVPDVAITDGAISYEYATALPAGTHSFTVTVGEVVSDAASFTVEAPVVEDVVVESVSAITSTTVTVVLTEAPVEAPVAASFTVLENGNAVAVSAVEKVASDLTNKTYKLTVASLNNKEGDLTVNGTAAEVATGMVNAFDFKAPEVTSVAVKGTKTLEITFNEKLDSAAANIATTNFTVSKPGAAAIGTDQAVLDATGTKVTLTIDTAMTVADYVLVLGNSVGPVNVEDVAGNGIYNGTEISFKPTASDLINEKAPELTAAVYDSVLGTLKVTFDKDVLISDLDATKLSINGVTLAAATSKTQTASNVITLGLVAADKTAVNALTDALVLTSAEDAYSDGTTATEGETFNVTKNTPAVITAAAYNQETNMLTLTFDQAVELTTAASIKLDTNTAAGDAVALAASMVEDSTATLSTWEFDLGASGATLEALVPAPTSSTLKVFMAADAVTNEADVANVAGQETYATGVEVTYTADDAKPELVSATYNNNTKQLKLTFSENIDQNVGDITQANIKIMKDASTNVTTLTNVAVAADIVEDEGGTESGTTLTFILNAATGTDLSTEATAIETSFNKREDMKIVLAASAVTDEASKANDATTYATGVALQFSDFVAPTVSAVSAENANLLKVTFSETVDEATAETVANYAITDSTGAALAVTSADVQSRNADGTMDVFLTTATQTAGAPYTIVVSNVKDTPGMNIIGTNSNTFNGSSVADAAKLTVDTLAAAAPANSKNDTLTITFNAEPNTAQATDVNNYVVLQSTSNTDFSEATAVSLTNATAAMVQGNAKQVKITLDSPNLQDGYYYKLVASNVTTTTGKALGTATGDADAVSAALVAVAPAAPSIVETDVATGAVVLTFGEELIASEAAKASNYTIASGENVIQATYAWDADAEEATVTLDVDTALTAVSNVTMNAAVTNLAGKAFAVATVAAPVALTDITKPEVTSVTATTVADEENDTIAVVFDENVVAASVIDEGNWTVKDKDGTVISADSYSIAATNATTATITFDGTGDDAYNLQTGETYSVTINGVMDAAGNEVSTTESDVAEGDDTAFTFADGDVTATGGGATVVIAVGEELDPTTIQKADFTVTSATDGAFDDSGDETNYVIASVVYAGGVTDTITINLTTNLEAADATAAVEVKLVGDVKDLAGNVENDITVEHVID
ncbi:hypothetical protein SAMN02745945_01898 [Peptoclostridium litorale DSM 5388]|uniref:SbsA Ig-like domain-containing protein n=1 Tax=Peptoclostridium litorale DSM 5388 TaxID=1121324 RepID=A0A069RHC0_PEPLI|nr:Ig-like domain-containing protein [Peptoclostridium litorale]KDR96168.1 hypothetical protein CLIT_4c00050 [Peptoclostridium litorale DSM 5388]SIO12825.1 hypothetical protein SAMN02745945_01898 [Peptoclostridium litorale DSM 5388]